MLIRCLDNIDNISTLFTFHNFTAMCNIRFFTQKSPEYFRDTWPQLEAIMRSGAVVEEENGEVNLSRYKIYIYNIYNISTPGVPLLGLPPAGGASVPPPGRHAGLHLDRLPRHLRAQGEHWISGYYPQHLNISSASPTAAGCPS